MTLRPLLSFIAALLALPAAAQPLQALPVFSGQPLPGWRISVADFEAKAALLGDAVSVPKPAAAKVPASAVSLRRSDREGRGDALTLQFREAWYAALRFDAAAPLNLAPWLADGVLAFDLKVAEMAKGGLHVALNCGEGCGRKLNFVLPSRALAGQGWQTLAFPLRCFVRPGDDWPNATPSVVIDGSGTGEAAIARLRFEPAALAGTPSQACPDVQTQSVTAEPLNQVWALAWWHPRHEKKLAEARALAAAGQGPRLLMIGDSITHGWEDAGRAQWDQQLAPLGALNLGFGGDKTENVLWRLQHGALDGFQARVVTLMIGTNNTGDRMEDARTTAAGIARLVQEIRARQPQARVLLLAIFPRDEKPDSPLRQRNEQINALIAPLADGRQVHWLNLNDALMNADGTLSRDVMPDLLHLSPRGYGLWADRMLPVIRQLMAP